MSVLDNINLENVPSHVAVIMDGNGRWAKQKGEDRLFGHQLGVESVREVLKAAQELNVKHLTLYAFSTENWNRPEDEVAGLMSLLVHTISNEVDELDRSNVRITTIGDIDGLPDDCEFEMKSACERTKNNSGVNLVLALNYSSRWEITNAVKIIASKIKSGESDLENISDELVTKHLETNIPDPELIIRTSGEHRLSNFLLWQAAYSELYFTDLYWPDFNKEEFFKAVLDYQSRERRFGKTTEQIEKV